jgi:hypothetical protein
VRHVIIVPIEENHERIAGLTDAKFKAADYSGSGLEALGAGLTKFGEGGEQFATALDDKRKRKLAAIAAIVAAKLDDDHQRHIDDAAVKNAYVDYADNTHQALHGDDGLFKQRGAAAHAAFPDLVGKLVDNHDKVLGQLDGVQRSAIAPVLGHRLRSDVETAADHVRAQAKAEQQWQVEKLKQATLRDAVASLADPERHDHHMATGENATIKQGRIKKLSDKEIDRQVTDFKSAVHAATIDTLTETDPAHAAGWYARYGDKLNDVDKQRVEAKLVPALADARAVADVDANVDRRRQSGDDAIVPFVDEGQTAAEDPLHDIASTLTASDASRHVGDAPWWSGIAQPASADDLAALALAGKLDSDEGDDADTPGPVQDTVDRIMREMRRGRQNHPAAKPTSPYPATPAKTAPIATMPKSWPIPGEGGQPAGTPAQKGARDLKQPKLSYADGRFDGTGALKYRLQPNRRTGISMGHRHQGVDLPGRVGTPVKASADGVVIRNRPQGVPATILKVGPDGKKHREPVYEPQRDANGNIVYQGGKPAMIPAFKTAGYGNVVVVSHADGAYLTWYGHLEYQSNLKPGTQIPRGSALGVLGNSGNARGQGSHVHFGVQKRTGYDRKGKPIYIWIDPIDWMRGEQ